MKTTKDYLLLCPFLLGPLVFSSHTPAFLKAVCQVLSPTGPPFNDILLNLPPLKEELVGMGLILSYTIHILNFWKLLLSCVLDYQSIQIFPTCELLRLTFHCHWSSHFHSFSPSPTYIMSTLRAKTSLLAVLLSARELSSVWVLREVFD